MPGRRRWPASWPSSLAGQGHTPLLVAADLQRPNAVNQLQIVAERAGVDCYAPQAGQRHWGPGAGGQGFPGRSRPHPARPGPDRHRWPAGDRRRTDGAGRRHP
ncbi:MAG: hypothetical protein V9G10_16785 [Candidatus Nanopelagicales bacterium]